MLDEMQAQWLARVAEGCAHAQVGLTVRSAFSSGLPTDTLLHVMGYVFGGTQEHLQSCISMGRVVAARGKATAVVDGAVAAATAAAVPVAKRAKVAGASIDSVHDQEQLPPRLSLVSHALALAATPVPQPVGSSSTTVLGVGARLQLRVVLIGLGAAAEAAEGGCEWLHAYCNFLQWRHRLV
jgi:hypothetical protein